jgi:hypothetical protein
MHRVATLVVAVGLLLSGTASAQDAAITGVVTDASGAVLPGVTVETTSAALTEKVRSVVTDGTGQYRIVALPPGTYALTYVLPGFGTVKREGIQLSGAITATVNVELRVGALQETVTVTGESPIVDVQSARRQQVIDGDVLAAIPTSRSYNDVLQLVPGVVAGNGQVQLRPGMLLFTAHGGSAQDGRLTVDGINTGASRGGAGVSGYIPDMQNAAEVAFTISGNLGEAETGGPQMSVVPKQGGNTFSGSFFLSALNDAMQADNFDAAQLSVLAAPAKSLLLRDYQVSLGGPVIRDRMWFFFNHRGVDYADAQPGIFANKNAGDPTKWTYEPDFSRQGRVDQKRRIFALRLTAQVTPKNKISLFWDEQPYCSGAAWPGTDDSSGCQSNKDGWIYGGSQTNGFFGPGPNSPETGDYQSNHQRVQQVKYTAPATNRLLIEAGFGTYISQWGYTERPGNPTASLVRVQEQSAQTFDRNGNSVSTACADCLTVGGNLKYRSSNWPTGYIFAHTWSASSSYVTGAHSMKFGYQGAYHRDDDNLFNIITNDERLLYRFNNGVPNQVTIQAGPWKRKVRTQYYAFFAQEQWTKNRLTLQGALRFDHAWSSFPQQTIGPDVWVPTPIDVPAGKGVEGYNDISPRVGVAYDLFGNGKTSLKGNIGKYMHPASNAGRFVNANPSERITTLVARTWVDGNRNYVADCDLLNFSRQDDRAAGGDLCDAPLDQTFGQARPTTTLDPSILSGWGVRPYDWQLGVSVQQEIAPRISVEAGYYRRWWPIYDGTDVTDNIRTSASDYTAFGVVAPTDARLPNSGGYVVPGVYNITPAGAAAGTENVQKAAAAYGNYSRYWDGFDITAQARLRNGLTLQGGTSTGRLVQDICNVRTNVPELSSGTLTSLTNPWCDQSEPLLTTYKALATYLIPKADVQVAGTFSSRPGVSLLANVVYSSSAVQGSLGRPLTGVPNVTVNVIEPNTVFGDRIDQLDLRIGKLLQFGRTRTAINLDVVNALNSNDNLAYSSTFSPSWPAPTQVLTARLFRISAQVDF